MTSPTPPGRPRPAPLADAAAAVGFLTLLPVGRHWPGDVPPRSVGWYPWVGWLLGAAAAGPLAATIAYVGHPPVKGAVLTGALVVAGWGLLTRLLHWDGLADTADGVWGGATPERRLEIMRDSRIGSFGAAAMLLTALVQVGAIADVVAESVWWPLLVAPVMGRAAAALAVRTCRPARADGLGLSVGGTSWYEDVLVALAVLAAAALGVAFGPSVPLAVVVAAVAGLVVPRLLARPVGGVTGDILGATVLLVETVVLVTGAVLT